MKSLTVIRHAKSSWTSQDLSDFDRPLNARGERTAPQMAKHLNEVVGLRPDHVVSSPALRAISTARIIAPALGVQEQAIVENQAVYNAELRALIYAVQEFPNGCSNAMLFGHMPGVHELVQFLTGSSIDHYSTCGVSRMELDITQWQDANLSCGKLTDFLYPKMLDSSTD